MTIMSIHSATPILPVPPLICVQLHTRLNLVETQNQCFRISVRKRHRSGVSPYTEIGGLSWTAQKSSAKSCSIFNYDMHALFVQCYLIIARFCSGSQEKLFEINRCFLDST